VKEEVEKAVEHLLKAEEELERAMKCYFLSDDEWTTLAVIIDRTRYSRVFLEGLLEEE